MKSSTYFGIDPGINGAIAWIDKMGHLRGVKDMPTEMYLANKAKGTCRKRINTSVLLKIGLHLSTQCDPVFTSILLERVTGFGNQGALSSFNFGDSFGCARMLASIISNHSNDSCSFVEPPAWKRYFSLIKQPKADAIQVALDIVPNADAFLVSTSTSKITKAHLEGRADAILIAKYNFDRRKEIRL